MKTFRFQAFQDMKGYYKGYLEIEAKNKEESLRILNNKSQSDLETECFNWTHSDFYEPFGNIDIDTESIHEV